MNKKLPALLFALAIPTGALAARESGASFLGIPQGARAMSLSNAFTTAADPTALFHNIAGIAPVGRTASFTHQRLTGERSSNALGYTHPLSGATLGVGLTRLSYGALESRDANGAETGSFEAYDQSLHLAAARRTSFGSIGLGVKVIQQSIAGERADGLALDAGAQAALSRGISAGLAVQNLGPGLRFGSESYPLPLTISLGASLKLSHPLAVQVDLKHMPHENRRAFAMGSEFWLVPSLALRAGYMALSEAPAGASRSPLALAGLAAGMGLKLGAVTVDYAFTPASELGDSQRLTLGWRFQ